MERKRRKGNKVKKYWKRWRKWMIEGSKNGNVMVEEEDEEIRKVINKEL